MKPNNGASPTPEPASSVESPTSHPLNQQALWSWLCILLAVFLTVLQQCVQLFVMMNNGIGLLALIWLAIDVPIFLYSAYAALFGGPRSISAVWLIYCFSVAGKLALFHYALEDIYINVGVILVFYLTPIIYICMVFRSRTCVGGLYNNKLYSVVEDYDTQSGALVFELENSSISIESLLHNDLALHVAIDLIDVIQAFSENSSLGAASINLVVNYIVGGIIVLAICLLGFSMNAVSTYNNANKSNLDKTMATDLFISAKHYYFISLFVIDIPLMVYRIYVSFFINPLYIDLFLFKNILFLPMRAYRLHQCRMGEREIAKGTNKTYNSGIVIMNENPNNKVSGNYENVIKQYSEESKQAKGKPSTLLDDEELADRASAMNDLPSHPERIITRDYGEGGESEFRKKIGSLKTLVRRRKKDDEFDGASDVAKSESSMSHDTSVSHTSFLNIPMARKRSWFSLGAIVSRATEEKGVDMKKSRLMKWLKYLLRVREIPVVGFPFFSVILGFFQILFNARDQGGCFTKTKRLILDDCIISGYFTNIRMAICFVTFWGTHVVLILICWLSFDGTPYFKPGTVSDQESLFPIDWSTNVEQHRLCIILSACNGIIYILCFACLAHILEVLIIAVVVTIRIFSFYSSLIIIWNPYQDVHAFLIFMGSVWGAPFVYIFVSNSFIIVSAFLNYQYVCSCDFFSCCRRRRREQVPSGTSSPARVSTSCALLYGITRSYLAPASLTRLIYGGYVYKNINLYEGLVHSYWRDVVIIFTLKTWTICVFFNYVLLGIFIAEFLWMVFYIIITLAFALITMKKYEIRHMLTHILSKTLEMHRDCRALESGLDQQLTGKLHSQSGVHRHARNSSRYILADEVFTVFDKSGFYSSPGTVLPPFI